MMTQIPTIAQDTATEAHKELLDYLDMQALVITSTPHFEDLELATQNIVSHAKFLAQQKKLLTRSEYKQLLKLHGWRGEEKKYIRVATAFKDFTPEELAGVEPATIFRLANNLKKYQPVIDELKNLPSITQEVVRVLMEKQRAVIETKEEKLEVLAVIEATQEEIEEKPSIWRRTEDGNRYCQIPPIHEENGETGIRIQRMMEEEGLTAQSIVAEAISLREAFKQGRLILIAPVETSDSVSEEDDEIDTALTTEDDTENSDGWTFEVEEDDGDDLMTNTVDEGSVEIATTPSPSEEESSGCGAEDGEVVSPVEVLIETFQTATSWGEIREVLLEHNEYKQEAWFALTPVERRRVMAMMPEDIKKLSKAKKAGVIDDFKEVREGFYQIRRAGNLFWEPVSSWRLDAVLGGG
jgi:hypothetical protein